MAYRRSPLHGGETAIISTVLPGKGNKYIYIDNSWVVLHSPKLIWKFDCHLNAELCISKIGSIKYLFKMFAKDLIVLLQNSGSTSLRTLRTGSSEAFLLSMKSKAFRAHGTFQRRKPFGD